jgi:ABC-2 type transport system permease protein
MADTIRGEWLKLRTTRSNLVLLVLAAGVPVLLTLLVTASVPADTLAHDTTANDRFGLTVAGVGIAQTLVAVLGVLMIGAEYRHNTIRVTFAAVPVRRRVHASKIVLMAAVGTAIGAVTVLSSYLVGAAVLGARGHGVALSDEGVTRALLGAVLLAALYGLVGLGLGTMVRATAAAITAVVVWPVVIESLVAGFLPDIGKFLPFTAGGALVQAVPSEDLLSPWAGGTIFALFAAALLLAGGVMLDRRDA